MKAVLVIDIDDSLIEGDERFAVDGYLMQESDCVDCYEAVGLIRNAVLKPMPKEEDIYEVGMNEEDTRAKQQWNKGWNACIEEITGETE